MIKVFTLLLVVMPALAADQRRPVSQQVKKELLAVFKVNEQLHQAFFKEEKQEIAKTARRLDQTIEKISDNEIKKHLEFSRKKLLEISADSPPEENNQRYHLVSMALIYLLTTYDVGEEYNAYSCPMIKMKWVQNSSKLAQVRNPYAADMPHCGSKDSDY